MRCIMSLNTAELRQMPSILAQLGQTIWTLDAGGRSVLHHICAIAGAAAFEAAKAYENHAEANGHPPEHAMAKELL